MEAPQRLHAKKTMIKLSEPLILTLAVATALAATSCGTVFEALEPCRTGVEMRFVYDCNLESANAFPTQVECLTLHIFDSDGGFVTTVTETSSVLSDENWRLTLDLEPGSYHAIAYGGIACGDDSFAHDAVPAEGSDYHDIAMRLKQDHIGRLLADHFHGSLDFEVDDNPAVNDYSRVTLSMRKTTNRFRILLQQLDGTPVDGELFDFFITDNNSVLDCDNVPLRTADITYSAWNKGSVTTAETGRAGAVIPDVTLGFGELSTSRLHTSNHPSLVIRSHVSGRDIVELPLNRYLLFSKASDSPWSDQEYLDRCSSWNLTFFLDRNNLWEETYIIVNGWRVRIEDTEF